MSSPKATVLAVLKRLGAYPRLAPYHALYLGSPTVKPSLPFAFHEMTHRKGLAFYEVRENGCTIAVRHGAAAVVILGEVFNRHVYRPSDEIERALGEVRRVVDLGGNIGLFGLFATVRWPESEVVAFEPDPDNAAVHEMTITANDLSSRWQLIRVAASNRDGQVAFSAGLNAMSHIADTSSGDATIEVPAMDVLPQIADADLLKMDIEGGEWSILGDARFREAPPRAVVLEYHSHLCPGENPRAEAELALRAAGMKVTSTAGSDDRQGMLWAWRP